ncbi:hypothetical protein JW824_12485 [bacterium]|nr:hypothetical protein [bacterium]RQV92094.1 MAG: hypothetical protein EH221_12495 [bacterium]
MAWIKRKWTTAEADEWTKEDWLTIVISPIAYTLIMLGIALSFLLLPVGFVILGLGIIATIVMHKIIDPKLKAISDEYEKKQKDYILELERSVRWEDENE